jgi:hypothetical protein
MKLGPRFSVNYSIRIRDPFHDQSGKLKTGSGKADRYLHPAKDLVVKGWY